MTVSVQERRRSVYSMRLPALVVALSLIAIFAAVRGFAARTGSPAFDRERPAIAAKAPESLPLTIYLVESQEQRLEVEHGLSDSQREVAVFVVQAAGDEAAYASSIEAMTEGGQVRIELVDLRE